MIYHEFHGQQLSALGLGCMRFPLTGTEQSDVDMEATAQIVDFAIRNGINYFDTAWPYHGGKSESIMGQLLSKYPRSSYYLATKFPGFDLDKMKDAKAIFQTQLERCRTEYFDFYLCHNVCERNIGWFTDPQYGVVEYLIEQKKAGHIRHLGFSTHGSRAVIKRFLDAYGSELDFCQIQLNYLDWELQSAKEKVELLNNYGIPVWVMEPVRGGKLANLNESQMQALTSLRPGTTAPEWAFRFLQSIPGVTMVLSGMSNLEQLTENIRTFSESKPLSKQEKAVLLNIADEMIAQKGVPCTACGYCVEKCVQGLNIPELIKTFNENTAFQGIGPDACIGCRRCEALCPQGIKISEVMSRFCQKLKEG